MNTNQDVVRREGTAAAQAAETLEAPAIVPPVDVTEDDSGITLLADLPGVSRETLALHVDGDTLTIEAPLSLGEPARLDAVYAEMRARRYRRSFQLSRELDTSRIDASLKDGVLTLRLPKLEQARPRRIEIQA